MGSRGSSKRKLYEEPHCTPVEELQNGGEDYIDLSVPETYQQPPPSSCGKCGGAIEAVILDVTKEGWTNDENCWANRTSVQVLLCASCEAPWPRPAKRCVSKEQRPGRQRPAPLMSPQSTSGGGSLFASNMVFAIQDEMQSPADSTLRMTRALSSTPQAPQTEPPVLIGASFEQPALPTVAVSFDNPTSRKPPVLKRGQLAANAVDELLTDGDMFDPRQANEMIGSLLLKNGVRPNFNPHEHHLERASREKPIYVPHPPGGYRSPSRRRAVTKDSGAQATAGAAYREHAPTPSSRTATHSPTHQSQSYTRSSRHQNEDRHPSPQLPTPTRSSSRHAGEPGLSPSSRQSQYRPQRRGGTHSPSSGDHRKRSNTHSAAPSPTHHIDGRGSPSPTPPSGNTPSRRRSTTYEHNGFSRQISGGSPTPTPPSGHQGRRRSVSTGKPCLQELGYAIGERVVGTGKGGADMGIGVVVGAAPVPGMVLIKITKNGDQVTQSVKASGLQKIQSKEDEKAVKSLALEMKLF